MTENSARVYGSAEEFNSFVQGNGGVGAYTSGKGAYAGGNASFNYLGGTSGAGNATVNVQITDGGVSASANAHASSIGNAPVVD